MADAQNEQEPSIEEILASIREIISDEDKSPANDLQDDASSQIIEDGTEDDDVLDLTPFAQEAAAQEASLADKDLDTDDEPEAIDAESATEEDIDDEDATTEVDEFSDIEEDTEEAEPESEDLDITADDFVLPAQEAAAPAAPLMAPKPNLAFTEPLAVEEAQEETQVADDDYMSASSADAQTPAATKPESLLTESAKAASLDSLTKLAQNIAISRAGAGHTLEELVREMLKPMLREWLDSNLPPMIERMVERELERLVKQALDR